MMSVAALIVSMLMAYQVASDLLCFSVADSLLVQEFSGTIVSTASSFIVPLAPSGHVAEVLGSSALQLALSMVELRQTLGPAAKAFLMVVCSLSQLLPGQQIPLSSLVPSLASVAVLPPDQMRMCLAQYHRCQFPIPLWH